MYHISQNVVTEIICHSGKKYTKSCRWRGCCVIRLPVLGNAYVPARTATAELKCVQEKLWLAKEMYGMKAHPHRDDDRSPVPGCPCSRRLPKDVSSGFEENYQGKCSDRPSGSTETIPEVLCLRQCYSLLFVCHLIRADNRMPAITRHSS